MLIQGSKLNATLRAEVLQRYVHRWTVENMRQTYKGKCPACEQAGRNGRIITGGDANHPLKEWTRAEWHEYHVPLETDDQWLSKHGFEVMKSGRLSEKQTHAEPWYEAA
jgi:hypothetical protein